jgi:hypothetical protein
VKLFHPGKSTDAPQFTFAAEEQTQRRAREVQLLVNLIEPDPKMQPWFLSDEAGLDDIGGFDDLEIRRKLEAYFKVPVRSNLESPLWQLVDLLKAEFPGWPDDPPEEEQR